MKPTQLHSIAELMKDGVPRTLREIVDSIHGISEAGVSARLRELRAKGWEVRRHKVSAHYFRYSLHPKEAQMRFA